MDQAKWRCMVTANGSRNPKYQRKRGLFYMYVFQWQLKELGLKRVHVNDKCKYPTVQLFCGEKKLMKLVIPEMDAIAWSMRLKGKEVT